MTTDQHQQFALHIFRDGLSYDEAARRAGMPDGPTQAAREHLEGIQCAMREAFSPRANPRPYLTGQHRLRLDELTARDERWTTLAGYLYDPEATNGDVCPDSIAEFVAHRFVFTSRGRLFYLRADGGVGERSACSRGQFEIKRNGTRWKPTVKAMMRRIYPEVMHGDYECTDDPRDFMEHLADRIECEGAKVSKRCATQDEIDRAAWRGC